MRHRVTAMKVLVLTAMVLVGCAPLLSAAAQDATPGC